jgi:hypothetical protein
LEKDFGRNRQNRDEQLDKGKPKDLSGIYLMLISKYEQRIVCSEL